MGVSTTVSLALFSLILIMSLGVFISLIAISVRINDPARINLITDHVREDLDIVIYNNTKDTGNTQDYVEITNRWSDTSYIEYVFILDKGRVIYSKSFDPPIKVLSLESVNITCSDLNPPDPSICSGLFGENQKQYFIMIVTREGNSFLGTEVRTFT